MKDCFGRTLEGRKENLFNRGCEVTWRTKLSPSKEKLSISRWAVGSTLMVKDDIASILSALNETPPEICKNDPETVGVRKAHKWMNILWSLCNIILPLEVNWVEIVFIGEPVKFNTEFSVNLKFPWSQLRRHFTLTCSYQSTTVENEFVSEYSEGAHVWDRVTWACVDWDDTFGVSSQQKFNLPFFATVPPPCPILIPPFTMRVCVKRLVPPKVRELHTAGVTPPISTDAGMSRKVRWSTQTMLPCISIFTSSSAVGKQRQSLPDISSLTVGGTNYPAHPTTVNHLQQSTKWSCLLSVKSSARTINTVIQPWSWAKNVVLHKGEKKKNRNQQC